MPNSLSSRILMSAVLVALLAPTPARPEDASPKVKIKKNPAAQETAAPGAQTQTAPANKTKTKKPPAPGEAGILEVQGMVMKVVPEQHLVIIRTNTNDYQIFLTPKSVMVRNGKPAELKEVLPGDRVDSCRFTAKKAIEKLTLSSVGRGAGPAPPVPVTP
jgi:hypothetical protein